MSILTRARDQLVARLQKRSVVSLVRLACWIGLVALAVMAISVINPRPLTVIFAMSIGQVIGILAFLCYLISILLDVVRGADHSPDAPGPAQKFREPNAAADGTRSGPN